MLRGTDLGRKALAELLGTAFLVAAVVGSGIAAQRLSPGDVGLELLENTLATAAALVALILTFGPVSGAHLNPVVTLVDRWFGRISTGGAAVYLAAQVAGGVLGAIIANLMFGEPAVALSTTTWSTGPHLLGEAVATFGLVLVIFGIVHSGRATVVPFAVAAYIGAAYWFTSSTSFANPAVTFARMLTDTFTGIAPSSVPGFVGLELVGGVVGAVGVAALYPRPRQHAADVLLPHQEVA